VPAPVVAPLSARVVSSANPLQAQPVKATNKIAAIASQLMRKILVHPESRPKQQSSNPNIGCDSTTTNPDVSNMTEGSQKRGKSSSTTRPSI